MSKQYLFMVAAVAVIEPWVELKSSSGMQSATTAACRRPLAYVPGETENLFFKPIC